MTNKIIIITPKMTGYTYVCGVRTILWSLSFFLMFGASESRKATRIKWFNLSSRLIASVMDVIVAEDL